MTKKEIRGYARSICHTIVKWLAGLIYIVVGYILLVNGVGDFPKDGTTFGLLFGGVMFISLIGVIFLEED